MSKPRFIHRTALSHTLLSSDSFNRANGAPGSTDGTGIKDPLAWAQAAGTTWQIVTNQLAITGFAATNFITVPLGVSDVDISITCNVADVNGRGIVFRYTDISNWWIMRGDNTQLTVSKSVAGVLTGVITTFSTINGGDVIRVIAKGNQIQAFNMTQNNTSTIAHDSFNQSATVVGLDGQGSSQRFDNWLVYTI